MKKIIMLFLSAMLLPCVANADSAKEYGKLISRYDVADEVRWLDNPTPQEFWQTLLFNDWDLRKFRHDMRKNKGLEKKALDRYASLPRFYPQFLESVCTDRQEFCDEIMKEIGVTNIDVPAHLYVIASPYAEAFSAPMEEGFAICLTTSLLEKPGMTRDMILGFVAREFAHGALEHSQRALYAEAVNNRTTNWVTAAGLVLNAALDATVNTIAPPRNDAEEMIDWIYYDRAQQATIESGEISKMLFIFRYTTEQEHEADLVAYRFMSTLGKGDSYLDCLRLLASNHNFLEGDNNTPSFISERINFIKYVAAHPELGNKDNYKYFKNKDLVEEALAERKQLEK